MRFHTFQRADVPMSPNGRVTKSEFTVLNRNRDVKHNVKTKYVKIGHSNTSGATCGGHRVGNRGTVERWPFGLDSRHPVLTNREYWCSAEWLAPNCRALKRHSHGQRRKLGVSTKHFP